MKNWSTIIGLCQKKRFLLHPSTDYFVICPRINSFLVERLLIIGALNSLQNSFIDCLIKSNKKIIINYQGLDENSTSYYPLSFCTL